MKWGSTLIMTRSKVTRLNLLGSDMVEIFVTDMYEGDTTDVIPYAEAYEAYYQHKALFDWSIGFTQKVLSPLF